MDEQALQRAKQRIDDARAGRFEATRLEAALERSRQQVEALATAAAELESSLPDRVGAAVGEGLRREVIPVGRSLAEIRGLLNQALRRLERLEQELLAERRSRIDDLALLVDLVSSGWQGVDERLRRLEETAGGAVIRLRPDNGVAASEHVSSAAAS
jgi:two-component sensor histidine kinase